METFSPRQNALFDTTEFNQTSHEAKDDFELLEMNLPGLCRGEEDDDSIQLDSSQYRLAADAVSRQNLRTELLKQVREKPWFSQSKLAYQNHHMPSSRRRRSSINEESFSYAKAIVESDAELERFSKEISSQLHLTEMMEVAVRAQRAADEGCETFSASMASFVPEPPTLDSRDEGRSDAEAGEQYHGPMVATPGGGGEPSQKTSPPFRHIAEVIPHFETMNAHMRTHFYRKKVDKKTLIFKEVEKLERSEQTFNLSPRSQGTEITADFFKNFSDYFGKRVRSQDDEGKKDTSKENIGVASGENDNGSLEEHIPLDLGAPSIPSVGSLASLNSLTVKPSRTIPAMSFDDEGEASISIPPPSPIAAGSSSANDQKDDVKQTMETLNTVSSSTLPTETDHDSSQNDRSSDGSSSSCPSSRFEELEDRAPLPFEIPEPVRIQEEDTNTSPTTPKVHDYNTPKRLRILKQSDRGEPSNTTPDPLRFNFSPSSIVASSVASPGMQRASLEECEDEVLKEQTRLLEIPRIGENIEKEMEGLTSSSSIDDVAEKAKRTRRIRMLRRRLDDEDNFTSETREGKVIEEEEEEEEEGKNEHIPLVKSPTDQKVGEPVKESINVSLAPRYQPDKDVELQMQTEEKGTISLCGPATSGLMETTSVAGIPLLLSSPSLCGDEKQYFKETNNDEYMNNYFYLSRLGALDRRDIDRQSFRRFICDETINNTGILCQDVGTSTCNDLDYLFLGTSKDGAQKANSPGRPVGSQAPSWFLNQIGLGFMYDNADNHRRTDSSSQH